MASGFKTRAIIALKNRKEASNHECGSSKIKIG